VKHPWFTTAAVYGSLGIFAALGVFLVGVGVRNIWRAISSVGWPTTPAVVVNSGHDVTRSSDGSSAVAAKIIAKYTVGAREYTTENIRFGELFGSGDSSVAKLQQFRYPEGSAISVSYNSADPELAVIETGWSVGSLWAPGAGVALILVSLMFVSLYRGSGSDMGMAFGVTLFAAIFMLIGTPMLLSGGVDLYRAYASEKWPATKGEIVYDEVDVSTSTTRERGRTRTSTTYGARIIFKYDVEGKVRYANTRRFGELSGSNEEWANSIADRYPAGAKFDVFYNPEDPNLAILEPGIESEAFWLPGAGLAFFAFGLAAALIIVPAPPASLTTHSQRIRTNPRKY
jgi:hypothetical protein